ncbi:cysteine peptidase family C39 domain-containing protein [Pseudomonas batumici]|uniref:C39 family peptidase n=1 Tax=Pseudomonas batumici TaxID=226910 RepID=UPI0030CFA3B3
MNRLAVPKILSVLILTTFSPQLPAGTGLTLKPMSLLKMQGIERQTLDYSCGAATLALLLSRYFEDPVTEEHILSDMVLRLPDTAMLERTLEGFSMLDLKLTAENLGYTADGVVLPAESVYALNGPVILLLRRSKLNHFVVLKGVGQGHAFLADPSRGHLRLPLFELFQEWQGETLIVGREGAETPALHNLSIPAIPYISPETEVVRTLQRIPTN